jgi:Arc/MetJ-type ribon-helix-helix transcriptional regulator
MVKRTRSEKSTRWLKEHRKMISVGMKKEMRTEIKKHLAAGENVSDYVREAIDLLESCVSGEKTVEKA